MFHSPPFIKVKGGSGGGGDGIDHAAYPAGEIHKPFNWIVADAAAKTAIVPVAADIHKALWQIDTGTVYILTNDSPVTWTEIGAGVSTTGAAFAARRTTNQVIPAATATAIVCDAEFYDTDSRHDVGTGRFVCNRAGYYSFSGYASCTGGFPANGLLAFRKVSGGVSTSFWHSVTPIAAGSLSLITVSGETDLLAGDYVEFITFANLGFTITPTIKWAGHFIRPLVNSSGSSDSSNITQLKRTATQSLPINTWSSVTFTEEVFDEASAANLGTSTTRITAPAGFTKIKLKATGVFASTATANSNRGLRIVRNSVEVIANEARLGAPNIGNGITADSPWLSVIAGDYFEMQATHSESSALNFGAPYAYFQAEFR